VLIPNPGIEKLGPGLQSLVWMNEQQSQSPLNPARGLTVWGSAV